MSELIPLREVYAEWMAAHPGHDQFLEQQERMRQHLVELLQAGVIPAKAVADAGLYPYHLEAELEQAKRELDDAEELAKKHRQTITDMDGTIRQLRRERDSRDPEDLPVELHARMLDRARASVWAEVQSKGLDGLLPANGRRRWRR